MQLPNQLCYEEGKNIRKKAQAWNSAILYTFWEATLEKE